MKKHLLHALAAAVLLTPALSARPWTEIQNTGELRVATRVRAGVMSEDQKSGFHRDLVTAFAFDSGRLQVKWVVKSAINDYFKPGVFDEVDFIADNLTATEDRRKFVEFVETLPTSYVLLTPAGKSAADAKVDLANQTIVVCKDTSYFAEITDSEKSRVWGKPYRYFYSATPADQVNDLNAGKGTITILDANLALSLVNDLEQITSASIGQQQRLGWAVPKGGSAVGARLARWLGDAKRDGVFQEIWTKNNPKLSYRKYLDLIDAKDEALDIPYRKEIESIIMSRTAVGQ